jgi:hypothetical protein
LTRRILEERRRRLLAENVKMLTCINIMLLIAQSLMRHSITCTLMKKKEAAGAGLVMLLVLSELRVKRVS